jgi:hypothetical protein
MGSIASFTLFVARLMLTSTLALSCQVYLIVKHPEYLLTVQEAIKLGSVSLFQRIDLASSYRVAYNLINGDGIVVHTLFVLLAFSAIYIVLSPLRLLHRKK